MKWVWKIVAIVMAVIAAFEGGILSMCWLDYKERTKDKTHNKWSAAYRPPVRPTYYNYSRYYKRDNEEDEEDED